MGVYKRLVFCQKLSQKSQFLASNFGGGGLLEHGRLLELLRYISTSYITCNIQEVKNLPSQVGNEQASLSVIYKY